MQPLLALDWQDIQCQQVMDRNLNAKHIHKHETGQAAEQA